MRIREIKMVNGLYLYSALSIQRTPKALYSTFSHSPIHTLMVVSYLMVARQPDRRLPCYHHHWVLWPPPVGKTSCLSCRQEHDRGRQSGNQTDNKESSAGQTTTTIAKVIRWKTGQRINLILKTEGDGGFSSPTKPCENKCYSIHPTIY